ncbi:MAG: hypothetical protein NC191_05245 [Muribaculaceae bacterium]|nr:hypothetical protein [Muribaculaceae bacterium]
MSYFEENRKFLGLNGILGRRDFIINCVIIEIIEALICTTPIFYILLFHPQLLSVLSSHSIHTWDSQWIAVVGLISSVLYFSSILRRVRDILGSEDENKTNLISGILTVIHFLTYLPLGFIGKVIGLTILIYLAATTGSISGEKPKNEIIKFNWGAFFGTWIWGLFNKTWITLLMIPLFFTFAGFPFMILCGLKGNEWSYKNKPQDSLEKFHKSQENQAITLILLTPILTFLFSIIIAICTGIGLSRYISANPELKTRLIQIAKSYQASAVESSFDKIEIKDGKYRFYTEPEDWKELPENLKIAQTQNAMTYALIKEHKTFVDNADFIEFIDIINNVEILSTFNNEPLAQFYIEPNEAKTLSKEYKEKKKTSLEVRKIIKNSYKLNNNPSLP